MTRIGDGATMRQFRQDPDAELLVFERLNPPAMTSIGRSTRRVRALPRRRLVARAIGREQLLVDARRDDPQLLGGSVQVVDECAYLRGRPATIASAWLPRNASPRSLPSCSGTSPGARLRFFIAASV